MFEMFKHQNVNQRHTITAKSGTYLLYAQFVNEAAKAVNTHFVKRPPAKPLGKVSLFAPETAKFSNIENESGDRSRLLEHFNGRCRRIINPIDLHLFASTLQRSTAVIAHSQNGFQSECIVFLLHVGQ